MEYCQIPEPSISTKCCDLDFIGCHTIVTPDRLPPALLNELGAHFRYMGGFASQLVASLFHLLLAQSQKIFLKLIMQNYFVACGGTGAHVMLAAVRLHILGYPFGFFAPKNGTNFPDFFLIDQDAGVVAVSDDKNTAIGEVEELLRIHPGRYSPITTFGVNRVPELSRVTPLPVGSDGKFFAPPNQTLRNRFATSSDVLNLITNSHQKDIDYSGGMMASPAVGSLLFSLKEFDINDTDQSNNDQTFKNLMTNSSGNPVVVCGSIIGGTGASVTPNLARQLHGKGSEVMAVLVDRWFKLQPPDKGRKFVEEADRRNKEMKENAASGLVSSAEELASRLPTVLVGATTGGMKNRIYGGDYLMPIEDSYIHVIAALASMTHLLDANQTQGLYGVSASNNNELTSDIEIGNSTLGNLIDSAEVFSNFLDVYCEVLSNFKEPSDSKPLGKFANRISIGSPKTPLHKIHVWVFQAVGKSASKVESVSQRLEEIKETYTETLDWLKSMTNHPSPFPGSIRKDIELNTSLKKRLKDKGLPLLSRNNAIGKEENIALSLYHWIAEWARDYYRNNFFKKYTSPTTTKQGGYWPSIANPQILPAWGSAGTLAGLSNVGNIQKALKPMFQPSKISQNGWPHPFAASKQFKFLIKNQYSVAIRKLEMLLVGHALGYLKLEPVKRIDEAKRESPSIDTLIENKGKDLVKYQLRDEKLDIVFGFSSPDTLVCPTPSTKDEMWGKLWDKITEYIQPGADWETSPNWGYTGLKARSSVAVWIEQVIKHYPNKSGLLSWATILNKNFKRDKQQSFGIVEWCLLSDNGDGKIKLPLPHVHKSLRPPRDIGEAFDANNNDSEIEDRIPSYNHWDGFSRIKKIFLPDLNNPISLMWKEHLDGLQKGGEIFAWGTYKKEDKIWILKDLESDLIQITNLRVIDVKDISISTFIPLEQNPVPGSSTKKKSLIFPDLPLLPEYISLAVVPPNNPNKGGALIDHNWEGTSNCDWVNNDTATWKVYLMGRPGLTEIKVKLSDKITPVAAHWMVWPNFKSPKADPTPWRAYYVYEDSSRPSLEAHVLTQKNDGSISEPKKRPTGISSPARAVEYDSGRHTGGAPVALCAYDDKLKKYLGIYKIKLKEFASFNNNTPWKLALDFGTSHTVVARKADTGGAKIVSLSPELTAKGEGMSLHISENWPDGKDTKRRNLLNLWRPTYVEKYKKPDPSKMLRSDLWSSEQGNFSQIHNVKQVWEPMTHYALPSWDLDIKSQEHIISGFKWEMVDPKFIGSEEWLQERYLGMAIELFVAEIINEKQEFPNEIQFTFTYPLRANRGNYKQMIDTEVFPNCEASLGCTLDSQNGLLLYNESLAAAGIIGTGNPCEVKLVADLGGGTLDVFISTSDKDQQNSRFKTKVADSAKIGANHLLRILAEKRKEYLPKQSDWQINYKASYINLSAWMRSKGSHQLFSSIGSKAPSLGLQGFTDQKSGNKARLLIDRYFQLIADFLARSLVAYVAKHVLKKLEPQEINDDLKIFLQLQGNGWRLWYQSEDYNDIHKGMLELIIKRSEDLWQQIPMDDPDFSITKDLWNDEDKSLGVDPKTGPICNAVGQNDNESDGLNTRHTFPLSRIKIGHPKEDDIERNWFDRLPFENLANGSIPRIKEFDPPLCLHPSDDSYQLGEIEDKLIKAINNEIENPVWTVGKMNAPIGAVIWEQVLKSAKFRE